MKDEIDNEEFYLNTSPEAIVAIQPIIKKMENDLDTLWIGQNWIKYFPRPKNEDDNSTFIAEFTLAHIINLLRKNNNATLILKTTYTELMDDCYTKKELQESLQILSEVKVISIELKMLNQNNKDDLTIHLDLQRYYEITE